MSREALPTDNTDVHRTTGTNALLSCTARRVARRAYTQQLFVTAPITQQLVTQVASVGLLRIQTHGEIPLTFSTRLSCCSHLSVHLCVFKSESVYASLI